MKFTACVPLNSLLCKIGNKCEWETVQYKYKG